MIVAADFSLRFFKRRQPMALTKINKHFGYPKDSTEEPFLFCDPFVQVMVLALSIIECS